MYVFIQSRLNDLTHSDAPFEPQQVVLAMSRTTCNTAHWVVCAMLLADYVLAFVISPTPTWKCPDPTVIPTIISQSLNHPTTLVPCVCLRWLLQDLSVHFWIRQFMLTFSYEQFYCFCHSTKSKCLWCFSGLSVGLQWLSVEMR